MSVIAFIIAIAAIAVILAGYYYSLRRWLDLPLDGVELHPIQTADGWRIMLYRHRRGDSNGEPVLLCHGFSANHWNLAAPRGASLADYLAGRGHDCWAIDLRGTRSSGPPPGTPRHRATFDGYVMQDLPAALAYIRKVTGHDQVHWVGHSLGGTLLYAYELAHGRAGIASGATIASPPGLHQFWPAGQSRLIKVLEALPGACAVGQRMIAPLHALLKPKTRIVPIGWDNLSPKFGVAEFYALAEIPPGPVTRTLEECARHRYLAVDNDRVNVLSGLNKLETPMLVMGCVLDPIVPLEQVRGFFERLPSADKRLVELSRRAGMSTDYDHIDPPFARHAEAEVFAPIAEWIAAHPVRAGRPEAESSPRPAAIPAKTVETPAPLRAAIEPAVTEPVAARAESGGLWGRALKDAASILDGLDEPTTNEPQTVAEPAIVKRARRPAAKSARAKSPARAKARAGTGTTSKASTKAKRKTKKPRTASAGRTNTKAKAAAKSKADSDGLSKAETPKKDKKKRQKTKDKPDKKKSKRKKSRK